MFVMLIQSTYTSNVTIFAGIIDINQLTMHVHNENNEVFILLMSHETRNMRHKRFYVARVRHKELEYFRVGFGPTILLVSVYRHGILPQPVASTSRAPEIITSIRNGSCPAFANPHPTLNREPCRLYHKPATRDGLQEANIFYHYRPGKQHP